MHEGLTEHSNNSTCSRDAHIVLGRTLVQTLVVFLHPLDGQNPVLSQCDTCNTQPLSQNDTLNYKKKKKKKKSLASNTETLKKCYFLQAL